MTATTQRHRAVLLRGAWFYFVLVMLAYAAVILTSSAPPTFIDFPDWVYQGVLFKHLLLGHPVAGYALKQYPVPNSTLTVGLGLLDLVLPWEWAAKVWVCGYLALAVISSRVLARVSGAEDWRMIAVLPGIIFLNLILWLGQISFLSGVCLLMLLFAMLLREVSSGWIAAMLVLLFFTHMVPCAGGMLLLGLRCGLNRRWRRLLAALPAVGLTLWYATGRFWKGTIDGEALRTDYVYGSPKFLMYKANTYFKTFGYVNARTPNGLSKTEAIFGRGFYLALIAAAFCISILCLCLLIRFALLRLRERGQRDLGIFVLLLLAISLWLPQTMLGMGDPGSRLLLIVAAIGLFLVDWRSRWGTALALLSVFFCVINLWQFARIHRDPMIAGHPKDLPAAVLQFGHAPTELNLLRYKYLNQGKLDVRIFPTGIFSNSK